MLCPGSPNIHLSKAVEEKNSSNLESLDGRASDSSCPLPIITATCGDAGDDNHCGAEKFCASNPDC